MRPRVTTRFRPLLLSVLLAIVARETAAAEPVHPKAEADAKKKDAPAATGKLPGDVAVEALKIREVPGSDGYVLEGAATIRSGRSRIQADRITYRNGRWIEAEGNVLVVWGGNRISGKRLTYDLEEERGTVEDAIGQIEPDFFFVAKTAEKVGQDIILLESATLTTCTQPVPYWSLSVSSARIRIDGYARMWNLRLKTGRVPFFYLPYMVWPVKKGRAAGLLIPSFGSTRNRGNLISEQLYLPLGPSVDVVLSMERFTRAGTGWGTDVSFVPNQYGTGRFTGFFIQDQVSDSRRHRATYTQTQKFLNGFRMVADVNQVSDFNYFTDYERDLRLVSMPTILARVEFSRNGSWTSVNVRELRREQLFSNGTSQIQETLPDLEFRGRSRRLGKTPFYFSYESSVASLRQSSVQLRTVGNSDVDVGFVTESFPLLSEYYRADLFPTVSAPVSPFPWLDITPSVNTRYTYYTQRQSTETREIDVGGQPFQTSILAIDDHPLTRFVSGAGVEMVGPKLFRILERPDSSFSTRYKNVIEPRIAYVYQEAFDRNNEVISYDQVDATRGATNLLTYGVKTRLFAQRPRTKPAEPAAGGEAVLLPEGTSGEVKKADPAPDGTSAATHAPAAPPPPVEPVEIASLEVRQSRSFGRDLSVRDVNADGVSEKSRFSSVDAIGRFNPKSNTSLDLRTSYDVLLKQMSSVSLSGSLRGSVARTGFSLVRTAGSTVGASATTQFRMATGVTLFGRKLKLDVDGSYNAQTHRVPDQRWRLEYYTQCCGFLAEWFRRDFTDNNRGELRITVDLRGIGKLMDLHQ